MKDWPTPAALRATPSWGQHQQPGKAGSAVFAEPNPSRRHVA
jgi:hypothetical protein